MFSYLDECDTSSSPFSDVTTSSVVSDTSTSPNQYNHQQNAFQVTEETNSALKKNNLFENQNDFNPPTQPQSHAPVEKNCFEQKYHEEEKTNLIKKPILNLSTAQTEKEKKEKIEKSSPWKMNCDGNRITERFLTVLMACNDKNHSECTHHCFGIFAANR